MDIGGLEGGILVLIKEKYLSKELSVFDETFKTTLTIFFGKYKYCPYNINEC